MVDILVRDVEDRIVSKLKTRARRNGRSLQGELVQILTTVTESDQLSDERTAERIKNALRGRKFSDSAALVREDRRR